MRLLCFEQTHPPAEDDDRDSDGARNRGAEQRESASSYEDISDDDAGHRKRRRKPMSILCKQDRTPKPLAPKPSSLSQVAKVSGGKGGGGLVRVRRSSLIKALSQPGRAIGVKEGSGKETRAKDSMGGVKEAAAGTASVPTSTTAWSKGMSKAREGKGETLAQKSQSSSHVMTPPIRAGAGTTLKSGSAPALGSGKRRDASDSDKKSEDLQGADIVALSRALTDLADRIPYMGVHTSAPKVWSDFNDTLAKVTSVAGIRKQWLWLTRQVWGHRTAHACC